MEEDKNCFENFVKNNIVCLIKSRKSFGRSLKETDSKIKDELDELLFYEYASFRSLENKNVNYNLEIYLKENTSSSEILIERWEFSLLIGNELPSKE